MSQMSWRSASESVLICPDLALAQNKPLIVENRPLMAQRKTVSNTTGQVFQSFRGWYLTGMTLAVAMISSTTVEAAFVASAPTNISINAGGKGSFDVLLSDTDATGSQPYKIEGVQLELRAAANSGITFTNATTSISTAGISYVFRNNSFDDTFGIPLATSSLPTNDLTTLDTVATGGTFTSIGPGQVVGLANISFSVASGATAGNIAISIVSFSATEPNGTMLSDPNSNAVAFTTQNGQIHINGSVPEPASIWMLLIGLPTGLVINHYRRPNARIKQPCV